MWHLYGNEDDDSFTLQRGDEALISGLNCRIPPAGEEEVRLLNHCEKKNAEGSLVLTTELVERRVLNPALLSEEKKHEMVWTVEALGPKGEKLRSQRQVFARTDCGSAEER